MPIAQTKDNLKLNDFLIERRKFMRIRFGDLSARTGIPAKHLKKIEKGEWCDLPSGVYVKGFLKKYAQTVGLDEAEVAARYESEWNQICALPASLAGNQNLNRFDLLKNISLRKIFTAAAAVFVIGYVLWQFRVILERPDLNLENPSTEDVVSAEAVLELAGRVSPGAALTVNNDPVYPEESGGFKKNVELLPGLNVLEIKAVSRFGKESKIIRRVTFNP
ncbi:MAG: helix-turn-helix domain-containing protein [Patescibacteria group bacterium]